MTTTTFAVVFQTVPSFVSKTGDRQPMPRKDLEKRVDALMTALVEREVDNVDIGVNLSEGHVEITFSVEAVSIDDAWAKGFHLLRDAIEVTGGQVIDVDIPPTVAKAHQGFELECGQVRRVKRKLAAAI